MSRKPSKRISRALIAIDPKIYNNLPEPYSQVEVYIQESRKLLKYSQYRKCFLTMDAQLQKLNNIPCPLQLRIMLCRRLIYCTSKILTSYMLREEDLLSKQSQVLFNRIMVYFQHYAASLSKVLQGDDKLKDICLVRGHEVSQGVDLHENLKRKKLIMFYTKEFISLLVRVMVLKSEYFKRISLDVKGVKQLYDFIDNSLISFLQGRPTLKQGEMLSMFKGSFYFNLREFKLSQDSYLMSVQACQNSLNIILNKNMKMSQPCVTHSTIAQMVLSFYMLSYLYEFQSSYQMCLESIKLAFWFSSTFLRHYDRELMDLIESRQDKLESCYKNYVVVCQNIRMQLVKLLNLEEGPSKPSKDEQLFDTYNNDLYNKLNVKELNQDSYIMTKSFTKLNAAKQAYYPEPVVIDQYTIPFLELPDLDIVALDLKISKIQGTEYTSNTATKDIHTSYTRMQSTLNQTNGLPMNSSQRKTQTSITSSSYLRKMTKSSIKKPQESVRARKLMQAQHHYTLPDEEEEEIKVQVDILNERRIRSESITEDYLKDALKRVYLNMIQSKFGSKELRSHRSNFEQRLQTQIHLEQTFQNDIDFAKGETKFKKLNKSKEFTTSYYTNQLIQKNIQERDNFITVKKQVNSAIAQKSMKQQKVLEEEAAAEQEELKPPKRLKDIVLEHSKSLGFSHLKKEIRQQELLEPPEIPLERSESELIEHVRNTNKNVTKVLMEQYESQQVVVHNKQRVLKQILQTPFVANNFQLAKSTSFTRLRCEKRKKISSFSDLVMLSTQLQKSRKLQTVVENPVDGGLSPLGMSPLLPTKFLALMSKKR